MGFSRRTHTTPTLPRWYLHPHSTPTRAFIETGGNADCFGGIGVDFRQPRNARLAIAGIDALKACQDLVDALARGEGDTVRWDEIERAGEAAKAALAKAGV